MAEQKMHVLLVEDDRRTAEKVSQFLGSHRFFVHHAATVRAAVELLKNESCAFDIIVSDHNVPSYPGVEPEPRGIEILMMIRSGGFEVPATTPFILHTSDNDVALLRRVKEHGGEHVQKRYDLSLFGLVTRMFEIIERTQANAPT